MLNNVPKQWQVKDSHSSRSVTSDAASFRKHCMSKWKNWHTKMWGDGLVWIRQWKIFALWNLSSSYRFFWKWIFNSIEAIGISSVHIPQDWKTWDLSTSAESRTAAEESLKIEGWSLCETGAFMQNTVWNYLMFCEKRLFWCGVDCGNE